MGVADKLWTPVGLVDTLVAGDIAATWGGLGEAISVALFVGIVPEMGL